MDTVQSVAILLPALLIGSSASQLVHGRIGQRQLRTGVLLFSLISGVVLLVPG